MTDAGKRFLLAVACVLTALAAARLHGAPARLEGAMRKTLLDADQLVPGPHPPGRLVTGGKPCATIVLPRAADTAARYAAHDCQEVIREITGAVLPVVDDSGTVPGNRVLLGRTRFTDAVVPEGDCRGLGREGYVARLRGRDLALVGNGPYAPVYALAEVYERLGARWFMPGDIGECLPDLDTVTVAPIDVRRVPSFEMRWVGNDLTWNLRNRVNLVLDTSLPPAFTVLPVVIRRGGYIALFHTQEVLMPHREYFDEHPDFFALVDGERCRNRGTAKLCNANPAVAEELARRLLEVKRENPSLALLNLSPTDGQDWCECEACRALDEPGVPRDQRYSRRQMVLYNRVARIVDQAHPGQRILVGAYNVYTWPPKDPELKAHPDLAVVICHYEDYCLAHPTNTTSCKPNRRYLELIRQWQEHTEHVFLYEYYCKANWLGLPWPIVHTIAEDLPFYHQIGLKGMYTQYNQAYVWNNFIPMYVATKLLWDHTADVAAILDDLYTRFYGSAAEPMRRWHETLERQMATCGTHMPGNAPRYAHCVFTEEVCRQLTACIEEARAATDTEKVRARVERMAVQSEYAVELAHVFQLRQRATSGGASVAPLLREAIKRGVALHRKVKAAPDRYDGIMVESRLRTGIMQRTMDRLRRDLAGTTAETGREETQPQRDDERLD